MNGFLYNCEKNKQLMPEGPEVKIASDYFNEFFAASKKIEFEI